MMLTCAAENDLQSLCWDLTLRRKVFVANLAILSRFSDPSAIWRKRGILVRLGICFRVISSMSAFL